MRTPRLAYSSWMCTQLSVSLSTWALHGVRVVVQSVGAVRGVLRHPFRRGVGLKLRREVLEVCMVVARVRYRECRGVGGELVEGLAVDPPVAVLVSMWLLFDDVKLDVRREVVPGLP